MMKKNFSGRMCFWGCVVAIAMQTTGEAQDVQVYKAEQETESPSVAINRKSPNQLVVVAAPEGVYSSEDEGKTWKLQAPAGLSKQSRDFLLHPSRKGEFYWFSVFPAGTDGTGDGVAVHVSEDNGTTWKPVGTWEPQGKNIISPRVAINQKTADVMMTWSEFDRLGNSDPQYASNIRYVTTKDGKKWSDSRQINQLSGNCLNNDESVRGANPASTIDGKTFIVWSYKNKIYLDRTFDKGSFWLTNDIPILDQTGGWSFDIPGLAGAHGLPSMTVDNSSSQYNGSLCLLYGSQRPSGETDIYFVRSYNLGDNWTQSSRISDEVVADFKFMPVLTVDNTTGILYGAYYASKSKDENLVDVYLTYSADNGTSFKSKRISTESFALTSGNGISIDAYRGIILVSWTAEDTGKRHVEIATLKQESLITLPSKQGKKK